MEGISEKLFCINRVSIWILGLKKVFLKENNGSATRTSKHANNCANFQPIPNVLHFIFFIDFHHFISVFFEILRLIFFGFSMVNQSKKIFLLKS